MQLIFFLSFFNEDSGFHAQDLIFLLLKCVFCFTGIFTKNASNIEEYIGIFMYNFIYNMYTNIFRNVGYIFYTFCIHQFWPTKSVHDNNYVYNLYTKFKQNVYKNNYIQNGSPISTFSGPFAVHFLSYVITAHN